MPNAAHLTHVLAQEEEILILAQKVDARNVGSVVRRRPPLSPQPLESVREVVRRVHVALRETGLQAREVVGVDGVWGGGGGGRGLEGAG